MHLEKALLMISWTPPKEAHIGNCANPISLHQKSSDLSREVEAVFNNYFKKASDYDKLHPQQLEMGVKA
jgi:hypothetical protein